MTIPANPLQTPRRSTGRALHGVPSFFVTRIAWSGKNQPRSNVAAANALYHNRRTTRHYDAKTRRFDGIASTGNVRHTYTGNPALDFLHPPNLIPFKSYLVMNDIYLSYYIYKTYRYVRHNVRHHVRHVTTLPCTLGINVRLKIPISLCSVVT